MNQRPRVPHMLAATILLLCGAPMIAFLIVQFFWGAP
jgi:hypothetical protein